MEGIADTLHESQTAAIQEFCHKEMAALHMPQDMGHLALRHDDRGTQVPFGTDRLELFVDRHIEHFSVEEDNGVEGLTLGGGGHLLLNGQMG